MCLYLFCCGTFSGLVSLVTDIASSSYFGAYEEINLILIVSSLPQGQQEVQQRKILYMGLYFLIWGEAANVRFMPECLCYIFHNVSI